MGASRIPDPYRRDDPYGRTLVLAVRCGLVLAMTACGGGDDETCAPTDPGCNPVASVVVHSPVDSVAAVGSTVALTAEARTGSGGLVSASVVWSSSNPTVASVSGIGTMNVLAAGTTVITATVGAASGSYDIRAVDADLQQATLLLGDASFELAVAGLTDGPAATFGTALFACGDAAVISDVLGVEACLDDASTAVGTDGNDDALLGYLNLFVERARSSLDLGR